MSLSYDRINWEDYPGTNTPLAAQNLNKMDAAISQLVDAVNALSEESGRADAPPVGHIILNMNNRNPGLDYPGTTWVQIAAGRALVGVGTGTAGTDTKYVGPGETFGEYYTRTVVGHSHQPDQGEFFLTGKETKNVHLNPDQTAVRTFKSSSDGKQHVWSNNTTADGMKKCTSTAAVGNAAVSNMQPSIGVYVWKRTA